MKSMSPIEWLRRLEEEQARGYERLLADAGCLAAAAHRVAKARCQTWRVATSVPTIRELRAAAREISTRVGLPDPLPGATTLATDCESLGLPVL